MKAANEIQHGGSHYKGATLQHWDFVVDHKMGYLEGCGTKYLSRHTKKNGLEDVNKAEHYVQKTLEKHLQEGYENTYLGRRNDAVIFCSIHDLDPLTAEAFIGLCLWNTEDDLLSILDYMPQIKSQYK